MRELNEYLRPASLDEALAVKRDRGEEAAYLAGGTDLLVLRPRGVTTAVDLMSLGLNGIAQEDGTTVIGATALLRDIERHPAVKGLVGGALCDAIRETGPWLIRNAATLAGNLCNASPSADSAPMLLALDAQVTLSDGRNIDLDQFFLGPHQTILNDEILTAIRVFPKARVAHFHKHARSKSDIALVNLAVSGTPENGGFVNVRIALGCVAPTPIRARESEKLLEGQEVTEGILDDLVDSVRSEIRAITDWRATRGLPDSGGWSSSQASCGGPSETGQTSKPFRGGYMKISLAINGETRAIEIAVYESLLSVLRREGYTGAKRVCESGECGACAVILDGRAVDSCILLAAQADGRSVTTIEGMGDSERLSPLQEAFADNGAIQCGFCIPGMIVTAENFLRENPNPSEEEVRHVFIGNLCRCTGYVKPVEAVLAAARVMKDS